MALATCVATGPEKHRPLPVDAIIPDPIFTSTHAITIDAPPERVWPWIAQMGAGRVGWYSWDAIDNGGTPSATRVWPELQTVIPGDVMPAVPAATDAFGGHAVASEHALVPLEGGAERGFSYAGEPPLAGSTSPALSRLPVTAASSSSARMRC